MNEKGPATRLNVQEQDVGVSKTMRIAEANPNDEGGRPNLVIVRATVIGSLLCHWLWIASFLGQDTESAVICYACCSWITWIYPSVNGVHILTAQLK